ncbi:hypothetical protein VIGAN_04024400 [Vigna angularis var. angularis]|uniref:Secreted protein n=1 Tax=Vigna angularis var. angularis TaxID=157739 RepID=A0A0S3RRD4_PHAAN|nr:hypothetical protein VIGAN_04024400 [Vigna angularis var. angularis]
MRVFNTSLCLVLASVFSDFDCILQARTNRSIVFEVHPLSSPCSHPRRPKGKRDLAATALRWRRERDSDDISVFWWLTQREWACGGEDTTKVRRRLDGSAVLARQRREGALAVLFRLLPSCLGRGARRETVVIAVFWDFCSAF